MSTPSPLRLLLILAFSAGMPLWGCGEEPAKVEHRKRLLKPRDVVKEKAVMVEKARLTEPNGDLIASDENVAGVILPRGMKLTLKTKNTWYFETKHPLTALHKYFGPRLFTGEIKRGGSDTVTFVNAIPKDTPTTQRVSVRIGPLSNNRGRNEVMFRLNQHRTVKRMTFRESQRQLKAAEEYAD